MAKKQMTAEEALEAIKKAASEGRVYLPSDYSVTVAEDGTGDHMQVGQANGFPVVMFTIVDGGGFTGMMVSKNDWENMKPIVDAMFNSIQQ